MSRYEHGRVLAVNETTLGSELVGDHAAGVGSLTVEDPVDFDEDGGWLSINGQVVEYATYDDDTGEITLVGTLDAAAGEGDRVDLWDELRQVVTVDKIAQVELDGDDDNTDPLEAVIPLHLLDDLAEGIRGLRGESVLLEQDGDEWRIVDVLGLAASGASGNQFWNDPHTVTATGQQSIALTHEPINNSEHLYWNGLYQPAVWSRSGQTITVPDAGGHLIVGDELVVEYAYRVGVQSPPSLLSVPLGYIWRYQTGLGSSTTYAQPGFDDSAWPTGPSPFGAGNYPEVQTTVPSPMDVWTRITVETSGGALTFTAATVDNALDVYVDGALVWSVATLSTNQEKTVAVAAGSHVIACHGTGDGQVGDILSVSIEEQ